MGAGQKGLKESRSPDGIHEHEHSGKEDQGAPVDPPHHFSSPAAEEQYRQSGDQGDIGEGKVPSYAQEHRSHLGQDQGEKEDQ